MHKSKSSASHSCSTFLLSKNDSLLVGHNLDDYYHVTGMVIINKSVVAKENISWDELRIGRFVRVPKVRWISKFGSITYNPRGLEFPDGGMNEAGLYVGEMSMSVTKYPASKTLPRFYHNQWIQYLLDNFATAGQVIDSLSGAVVDGHSLWHFFVADQSGESAVIEFLEGKPVVFTGAGMPCEVACNTGYAKELVNLREYEGFGGAKPIPYGHNEDGGSRFFRAAGMFRKFNSDQSTDQVKNAFSMLDEIKGDNNQWGILYDVRKRRMYFRTVQKPAYRHVDFSSVDFSSDSPPLLLDINQDIDGDVSKAFIPFRDSINRENIMQGFREIENAGLLKGLDPVSKLVFTKLVPRRLADFPIKFMKS
jgi:choloylglycine hydrolase